MGDLRSSKEQLNQELRAMYEEMTDPAKIESRRQKELRDKRIKENIQDYGL